MKTILRSTIIPSLPAMLSSWVAVCFLPSPARALDKPPVQVLIDSKLVETTPQAAKDLGVNYTVDKSQYNLFAWTPPQLRRPFVTDYGVASPITVDAGAFAADVGFGVGLRNDTKNDVEKTLRSYDIGYTTLKFGVLNKADFEVGIPTWRYNSLTLKDPTGQDTKTSSGFGNLVTRLKYNLFGDDSAPPPCTPGSCCGGASALSLSADMIWPTATDGYQLHSGLGFRPPTQNDTNHEVARRRDGDASRYEGGLSMQYRYLCGCGAEIRVSSGFILSQSDCGSWDSCFANSIRFSQTFAERYTPLVAFNTAVSTQERSKWQGSVQAGLGFQATKNIQFYLGSGFGVTKRTFDYGPNIRMDARF